MKNAQEYVPRGGTDKTDVRGCVGFVSGWGRCI